MKETRHQPRFFAIVDRVLLWSLDSLKLKGEVKQ